MAKYRKPKPKPIYQQGQMLAMRRFVAPSLYAGAYVTVLEVREATFDIRYRVEDAQKQAGWVNETDLAMPFEVA